MSNYADLIESLNGHADCMDIDAWTKCKEAAEAIEAQAKRIAELETAGMSLVKLEITNLSKRIAELEAENVKLLEALKPLSEVYIGASMKYDAPAAYTVIGTKGVDKTIITAGEVRAARIARTAYLGENKS